MAQEATAAIEEILARGERVLVLVREDSPEALSALEQYADAVGVWQEALTEKIQSEAGLSAEEIELSKRVSAQHEEILSAVKGLKGDAEASLKNLRSWAKGLRGYADALLPKRISTISSKKG